MRYIADFDTGGLESFEYDVVILGCGIAGLFAALNIDKSTKILVLSKEEFLESNTSLAQGGVAYALAEDDSPKIHFEDTMKGGSLANDRRAVDILVHEAGFNVKRAVELGVKFDLDEQGNFHITHEGGHSKRRVIHSGDTTGWAIQTGLLEAAKKAENITLMENTYAADLLVENGAYRGVIIADNGGFKVVYSKAIVIATGGCGHIYKNTTNVPSSTGDGIVMAERAGCELRNMEFMQFHPTALYSDKIKNKYGRLFLISETVRGEGGILRNSKGEAFMEGRHPMKDLAPRYIVSAAIYEQMQKENKPNVYLDITHRTKEYLQNRFPMIYGICLEAGIDMSKDYIPVAPAAHYTIGGIKVDVNCRTNIENIFACGECTNTGVHGGNRLAGNALLEGFVFGARAAKTVNEAVRSSSIKTTSVKSEENTSEDNVDWANIKESIQNIMTEKVEIVRVEDGLKSAKKALEEINSRIVKINTCRKDELEIKNMAQCALLVTEGAISRKESCGSHQLVHA